MSGFPQKVTIAHKKTKYMTYSKGRKSTEIVPETVLMTDRLDKGFKTIFLKLFTELKVNKKMSRK